jgi:hypothetical protein
MAAKKKAPAPEIVQEVEIVPTETLEEKYAALVAERNDLQERLADSVPRPPAWQISAGPTPQLWVSYGNRFIDLLGPDIAADIQDTLTLRIALAALEEAHFRLSQLKPAAE